MNSRENRSRAPGVGNVTPSSSSVTQTRGVRPVLYKSSALEATAPHLAFRRRESSKIAQAAKEADECREEYKRKRLAAAELEDVPGESKDAQCAKKYKRRLLLNRHSASASRLRKEAYCALLEKFLAELEKDYNELFDKVDRIMERHPEMAFELDARTRQDQTSFATTAPPDAGHVQHVHQPVMCPPGVPAQARSVLQDGSNLLYSAQQSYPAFHGSTGPKPEDYQGMSFSPGILLENGVDGRGIPKNAVGGSDGVAGPSQENHQGLDGATTDLSSAANVGYRFGN